MNFLAFLLGDWVYAPYSGLVAAVLRLRGCRVGRGFRIMGVPKMRIRGRWRDVVIGDGVTFTGDIDIRNRESGRIEIGDRCRIDHGVRLVAARNATLRVGDETEIGLYSVFNCGADVTVGRQCMISGFVYVQSSNHGAARGVPIKEQPHVFAPIVIGDDVLLSSHVSVLAGVRIGSGAIVGAKAVVTDDVKPNEIVAGVPARTIRERV